jgi:hypothetical protein
MWRHKNRRIMREQLACRTHQGEHDLVESRSGGYVCLGPLRSSAGEAAIEGLI